MAKIYLPKFTRIFFSPHPDDIAISCFASLSNPPAIPNETLIVTVFDQSQFNFQGIASAEVVTERRRREDLLFADSVGVPLLSLGFPDSSIRYATEGQEYKIQARQDAVFETVKETVSGILLKCERKTCIYIPLGVGHHVDHCIVRDAVTDFMKQNLNEHVSCSLLYYEDLPYASKMSDRAIKDHAMAVIGQQAIPLLVDLTPGWDLKRQSLEQYSTQLDDTTISTLLEHACRLGGVNKKAERLWTFSSWAPSPIVETVAWVGWEAARFLGGLSAVLKSLIESPIYRASVNRTILIGPLHMPLDYTNRYDPYEDIDAIAAALDSEILYRPEQGLSGPSFYIDSRTSLRLSEIENLHGVGLVYLRDRRIDSHVVERLLVDFSSRLHPRRVYSKTLPRFLDALQKGMDLPFRYANIHSYDSAVMRHLSSVNGNNGDPAQKMQMKAILADNTSFYKHLDNDTLYGMLMAEPAAESLGAILQSGETSTLIVQDGLSLPTSYAYMLNRAKYDAKIKTIFYAGEIDPIRNLADGSAAPEVGINELSGFDWEAPLRTIMKRVSEPSESRSARFLLDFLPLLHMKSHGNLQVLQHAWKLDSVVAVSDCVREELHFLDRGFVDRGIIPLFYHGTKVIQCSPAQKEQARSLLLSYARISWGFDLNPAKTLIFTHVSRAVPSKGFYRDLKLAHRMSILLHPHGYSILLLLITSWDPSRAHTSPVVEDILARISLISSGGPASNVNIRLINEPHWPDNSEPNLRPTALTRQDLWGATDASLSLSTYDSYNLASLEPLSCGAICVITTCCGSARRVAQLEEHDSNVLLADYGLELEERFPAGERSIDELFRITVGVKEDLEERATTRVAQRLMEMVPMGESQRGRLIERGLRLARRLGWDEEIRDRFLPILKGLFPPSRESRL